MRKIILAAALGAASLSIAGCGDNGGNAAANGGTDNLSSDSVPDATNEDGNSDTANGSTASSADAAAFPKGARIVEENGSTWRIDPNGTRVKLTDADSRIVVDNGVRYRVDPTGSRVKIDERGLAVDLTPDVKLPDVDVGINAKGHPDVDVKAQPDGDKGPN